MGIEPMVSHAQSKLGAIKPREYLVWTSLYVPYKIYIHCVHEKKYPPVYIVITPTNNVRF